MPLALLLALACAASAAASQKVEFKTSDGWTLRALYRAPRPGRAVMVLAHGVASSRGEWDRFAERLSAEGLGSLALDLRGHGESTKGPDGERDLKDFDATGEWIKAVADLRAAAAWLEARGVKASRIAFGGASIGANLASSAAADRGLLLAHASRHFRPGASGEDPVPIERLPGFDRAMGAHMFAPCKAPPGRMEMKIRSAKNQPFCETAKLPVTRFVAPSANATCATYVKGYVIDALFSV